MHQAKPANQRDLWLPVLLILVFAAFIVPRMTSTITYDEAFTFFWYSKSPIDALFRYSLPNNHLINSFFTWASSSYFGRAEFAIRLPAFYVGMMAVASVFRFTERLWGRMAAVAAVVMLATSAAYVGHATLSRGYVWAILFGTLLLMVVLFRRNPGYPAMLLSTLLMMTLPTMALLIGGVGLWSLRYKRQAAAPLITGTLMGSAFYAEAIATGKMAHFTDRFGWDSMTLLLDEAYGVFFQHSIVMGIGAAVFVLLGLFALRRNPRLLTLVLLIVGIPLVLTPIQLIGSGKVMYARLYLYVLVALIPMMGWGIASSFKRYTPLVLALWLLIAAPLLIYRPPERDLVWELIALIDEHVTPGKEAVLIGCCLDSQVEHYKYQEMWLFYPYAKERLYVLPAQIDTVERILDTYDLQADCTRADWDDFEVYECVNLVKIEAQE